MLVFEETSRGATTIIEIRPISKRLDQFLKRRGVKKSLLFPELGFSVSVEHQ
jgi:hypothetical protein